MCPELWVTLQGIPESSGLVASPAWGPGEELDLKPQTVSQGWLEGGGGTQTSGWGQTSFSWSQSQILPGSLPVSVRDTRTPSLSSLESPLQGSKEEVRDLGLLVAHPGPWAQPAAQALWAHIPEQPALPLGTTQPGACP